MAVQISSDSYSGLNVLALASKAVTPYMNRIYETGSFFSRLFTNNLTPFESKIVGSGGMKTIHIQQGGQYVSNPFENSRPSRVGPGNPMDIYTAASEQLMDEARWYWAYYHGRITADALEVAQCKGQGPKGVKDLFQRKAMSLMDRLVEIESQDFYGGGGYRSAAMLGAGVGTGRRTIQGIQMLIDGLATTPDGATASGGTGLGDQDGTTLSTAMGTRPTVAGTLGNYGGIDRDLTLAADWRGNLVQHQTAATASYTALSYALSKTRHRKGGAKFALAGKATRAILKALIFPPTSANSLQRYGSGEDFMMGSDNVGVDGAYCFEDEIMDSTVFASSGANAGYFITTDTSNTAAANVWDGLVEKITKSVIFINPAEESLQLWALEDLCDKKGLPVMEPSQKSELVDGEIASVRHAIALIGNPRDHAACFTPTLS